jgi:prefoldin subunit 5
VKGSDTGVVLTRDLLRAIGGGNPDYSTGLSATARKVLTSDAFSAITDEKDLTAALDFIKQYDDAIKSISKDMSAAGQAQQAYQDALDSINSQFDNLEASATKFGLSIDELERGRTAQIKLLDANKQASDWLQATFGDGKLNLQLTKWGRELADAQNEVAKAGNAAANAYQNQRNTLTNLIQSLDQASSSLASTKDSLLTGSLSTLSGEEKQSLIAGKYFSTLNSALGGDATALGGLGQASTDYLQILKDNGASGELYARAFNEVVANLDKAQAVARTQSDVATKQLKRLDDSYQQLVDLVSRVSDVNVTLEGLPADIGTAFRAALEANDRLKVTSNGIVAQQKAQFDQLAGAYGTYRANGGTEAGGEQIFGGARDALLASISDIGALNDIGVKFYTGATSTESNALRARIIAGGGAPRFAMGGITSGLSIAGEAGPEAIVPLPGNRMIPVQLKGLPGVESKLEAMAHQIEGLARAMVSLGADQLTVLRAIGGEQRATRMAIENPA